jgi:hypothetical protein
MTGDLNKAFTDLKNWMFMRYNGILIERVNGGFKVGENTFTTADEVKNFIDERRKGFYALIKKNIPIK